MAAAGLVHEKFHSPAFSKQGGELEMVQLCVNLPVRDKLGETGQPGPARTHTPIDDWDIRQRDAQWAQLARDGEALQIEAHNQAKLLLLGGEPFNEPIAGHRPAVMNTGARILLTLEDLEANRFGQIAA
ncbi:MAG: pirin-like C-terminal cupin domain-containing protein [Inhella sp.]